MDARVHNMKPSMELLIRQFPEQLEQALDIADRAILRPAGSVKQVLVAGMGGSGIGADLVAGLARPSVPMQAVKDYQLPNWAGPETLLIASSYSGNTEESLSVLDQALSKGCRVVGVSSGGRVSELSAERDFDLIVVPGGRPPRSTLGYSVVQQLHILHHFDLIRDYRSAVRRVAERLARRQEQLREQAAELAAWMVDRTPVLYGAATWQAVLLRWCQQIQENGKMLCWMNVFPELNHNELVGWRDERPDLAVLFFSSNLDHSRTARRIHWTRDVIEPYCDRIRMLDAEGSDHWEQAFQWIHTGDWLSVELARIRQMDPVEIAVIDRLKHDLAR